eukprot:403350891
MTSKAVQPSIRSLHKRDQSNDVSGLSKRFQQLKALDEQNNSIRDRSAVKHQNENQSSLKINNNVRNSHQFYNAFNENMHPNQSNVNLSQNYKSSRHSINSKQKQVSEGTNQSQTQEGIQVYMKNSLKQNQNQLKKSVDHNTRQHQNTLNYLHSNVNSNANSSKKGHNYLRNSIGAIKQKNNDLRDNSGENFRINNTLKVDITKQAKNKHSRMISIDASKRSTKHSTFSASSNELKSQSLRSSTIAKDSNKSNSRSRSRVLCSDYIQVVHDHLKRTETSNKISHKFLKPHKINGIYRAKMIDWIIEVTHAFKCSDQTFFLAVNIMDRYFDQLSKQAQASQGIDNEHVLQLNELHITGIVCMFIASKYEDVYPLLMKTVVKKIGHDKITDADIRKKEQEILTCLNFKVGALPTALEFVTSYTLQIFENHDENKFISQMSVYLAKLTLHHEKLCYKRSSMIAAASIYVAMKICEQMRKRTIFNNQLMQSLLQVSQIKEQKLIKFSRKVLYLAQNFELELPGLHNLRDIYIPELNKYVNE